ncbi:MAG: hypothetical protein C0415_05960 [Thermodesulfovibrio sp.]|nr:hypothetical protein [Thermodesulfovibrio sp.]
MMDFFFYMSLALVVALAVTVCLFFLKRSEVKDLRIICDELQGGSGLQNVVKVITDEIERKGGRVLGFFGKNRTNYKLEGDRCDILVLKQSSAARAFFTLEPCRTNTSSDADKEIVKNLGEDAVFLPIQMKKEKECWQISGCENVTACKCYKKSSYRCWVDSDKIYRGKELRSYKEKHIKCLNCKCFRPVGVFAVKGSEINAIHQHIDKNFSGVIKGSILFERLSHTATNDHLTNIPNKRCFVQTLHSYFILADRHKHDLSLCMLDIDHFKKFNDTYGHLVGDQILKELAGFVSSLVRETDFVARYGGEEFAIMFPHTKKDVAVFAAEKIRQEVEKRAFAADKSVTISMGVATCPVDDIRNIEEFIKKADTALYQSKNGGRNMVTGYNSSMPDMTQKKKSKAGRKPSPKSKDEEVWQPEESAVVDKDSGGYDNKPVQSELNIPLKEETPTPKKRAKKKTINKDPDLTNARAFYSDGQ